VAASPALLGRPCPAVCRTTAQTLWACSVVSSRSVLAGHRGWVRRHQGVPAGALRRHTRALLASSDRQRGAPAGASRGRTTATRAERRPRDAASSTRTAVARSRTDWHPRPLPLPPVGVRATIPTRPRRQRCRRGLVTSAADLLSGTSDHGSVPCSWWGDQARHPGPVERRPGAAVLATVELPLNPGHHQRADEQPIGTPITVRTTSPRPTRDPGAQHGRAAGALGTSWAGSRPSSTITTSC
jgi:hypothetical protein